jgi:hypothetical protein
VTFELQRNEVASDIYTGHSVASKANQTFTSEHKLAKGFWGKNQERDKKQSLTFGL